jgi:uncharacterized protein YdbL (DUF1318 family)
MSGTIRFSDRWSAFRRALLCALVLVGLCAGGALAQNRPLDAPRAKGIVGERFDGFAMVRDRKAPASIKQLVRATNQQRRALYQKRARATKSSVKAVGQVYAKQIFKTAPRGTWLLTAPGRWVRR